MFIKVIHRGGLNTETITSLYECGWYSKSTTEGGILLLTLEGKNISGSLSVIIKGDRKIDTYIMNDEGKTIEHLVYDPTIKESDKTTVI